MQPLERQSLMMTCFDNLMDSIERNLQSRNRDKSAPCMLNVIAISHLVKIFKNMCSVLFCVATVHYDCIDFSFCSFTKNLSVFRRDIYNSLKEVVPQVQVSSAINEMMV